MKCTKLALSVTAGLLALGLGACSTPVQPAGTDDHAPVVAGQTQASQGSNNSTPSASPSASPTATSKPRVAPAVKGVATDGKSTWVQTTINDTDPDFQVDLSSVPDDTRKKLSKEDWQAAWEVVAKYLAEEGIDSPLRNPAAANDPAIFKKWVADNSSRFVNGKTFTPGDRDRGNTLKNTLGIMQDDADLDLTYGTSGSKPRITKRSITTGTVSDVTDTSVKFLPNVTYDAEATGPNGEALVAKDETGKFQTTVVKEDGKWKIFRNDGTFYGNGFKPVSAK